MKTAEDVLRQIRPDVEVGAALRAIYVEQIRAYARECVEAWREKAVKEVESAGTFAAPVLRVTAALRALPGEMP